MKNFLKISAAILFIFCSSAQAAPYFLAQSIEPTLIDEPFSKQSANAKNEIEQILKLQKNPNASEIAKALRERNLSVEMLVQDFDESLSRNSNPKLYRLLDKSSETSKAVVENVKNFWNTKRPYLLDKRIKTLIEAHDNPAYPSGHTCESYVLAHILGLLISEKRQNFYRRAEEIAQHRVLVGMHFPNDLRGGKQLALLIVGGLLQNNEFQKDFIAAKEELTALK